MTLRMAFDKFIYDRKLRGLLDVSITDYKVIIGMFVEYIGENLSVEELQRSDIDKYIDFILNRDDITKNTAITYVRNMKIFLRYLENNEFVDVKAKTIRIPKAPKKNVKRYSNDEIKMIYECVQSNEEWLTYRNYCIISLMLDSGLRQAEVCKLNWSDIENNFSYATVTGKGSKDRIVPLGNITCRLLQKYKSICPFDKTYIFVTPTGTQITPDSVKHMMFRLGKHLPFEISSHKLRHNFATNYCLDQYQKYGRIDIYKLMVLMGHEDIATTRRYLHIANSIIAAQENISHLDSILGDFL